MTPDYWRQHASRPPLPCMDKPCGDCAITTGFYTPYADDLLTQPPDIQEKASASWFCHSNPKRACKGVKDYIEQSKED